MNDEINRALMVGFGLGVVFCLIVLIIFAEAATTDLDRSFYAIKERVEDECVVHEYDEVVKADDKFIITFTCK